MTRVIKRLQVVLKGATATNKPAGGRSESLKSLKSKCRGLLFKRWNQCVLENNWWRHEKIELCSCVFHHGVFQEFWGELNGSNTIKSRAYCHHFCSLLAVLSTYKSFFPVCQNVPNCSGSLIMWTDFVNHVDQEMESWWSPPTLVQEVIILHFIVNGYNWDSLINNGRMTLHSSAFIFPFHWYHSNSPECGKCWTVKPHHIL